MAANVHIPDICLPDPIFQSLSTKAAQAGQSLKHYVESLLRDAATPENFGKSPSPSGDPWYDVPENRKKMEKLAEDYENGHTEIARTFRSKEEIDSLFAGLL